MKIIFSTDLTDKKKFRRVADPLSLSETTNHVGEAHLESTMARFHWRLSGKTEDMDNQKVDYTYRLGKAEIEIQLKSRNIDLDSKNWQWVIYPSDKEIDKKFYDAAYTFLCLVGIKIVENEDGFYEEFIDGNFPQIALIPGKDVVKYFTDKSLKTGVMSVSLNTLLAKNHPFFKDYFGENNIQKMLVNTQNQQEEEAEHMEQLRRQKQQESS
jgi:hypothetical protein